MQFQHAFLTLVNEVGPNDANSIFIYNAKLRLFTTARYYSLHVHHHFTNEGAIPKLSSRAYNLLLILLIGELALIDLTPCSVGRLATRHVIGSRPALLPHLHVPVMAQLLRTRLPSLATPCIMAIAIKSYHTI